MLVYFRGKKRLATTQLVTVAKTNAVYYNSPAINPVFVLIQFWLKLYKRVVESIISEAVVCGAVTLRAVIEGSSISMQNILFAGHNHNHLLDELQSSQLNQKRSCTEIANQNLISGSSADDASETLSEVYTPPLAPPI